MKNASTYEHEKLLNPISGFVALFANFALMLATIAVFVLSVMSIEKNNGGALAIICLIASILAFIVSLIIFGGLKAINPNEAAVYVLFGNYYGTIAKPGFFFINPFCTTINPSVANSLLSAATVSSKDGISVSSGTDLSKKVSLKAITLNNEKQKVNDCEGNPIEIGVIVIWKVVNATKAVFEVDNYKQYISTQTDASLRQVARQYPYDISEQGDEKSLRGSSTEVADELKKDLQNRVDFAGIEIIEARIAHLAYAQEIAAAMLQRQQASAIIAARQKIVEGAVGMVEMALNKLSENNVVTLDDERKATMVSNLLVVLCGNKDAQPIVNSGSIY